MGSIDADPSYLPAEVVSDTDFKILHGLRRMRHCLELEVLGQNGPQNQSVVGGLHGRGAAALSDIYRVVGEWTKTAHG